METHLNSSRSYWICTKLTHTQNKSPQHGRFVSMSHSGKSRNMLKAASHNVEGSGNKQTNCCSPLSFQDVSELCEVSSVPTFIFYRKGRKVSVEHATKMKDC